MTPAELTWLFEIGKTVDSIVEIGSWKGRSTYALCFSGCPHVYAVDHFLGSSEHQEPFGFKHGWGPFPEFQHNISERFRNVELKRVSSEEAARDFADGSVDMVFIDGAHEYESVIEDITLWAPKARRIVAGHDQSQSYASVRRACGEHFGHGPDQSVGDIWIFHLQ